MSNDPAVTDWFPLSVDPARDGVYQTRPKRAVHPSHTDRWPEGAVWHSVWRGGKWFAATSCGVAYAIEFEQRGIADHKEIYQWRGLAKEPK